MAEQETDVLNLNVNVSGIDRVENQFKSLNKFMEQTKKIGLFLEKLKVSPVVRFVVDKSKDITSLIPNNIKSGFITISLGFTLLKGSGWFKELLTNSKKELSEGLEKIIHATMAKGKNISTSLRNLFKKIKLPKIDFSKVKSASWKDISGKSVYSTVKNVYDAYRNKLSGKNPTNKTTASTSNTVHDPKGETADPSQNKSSWMKNAGKMVKWGGVLTAGKSLSNIMAAENKKSAAAQEAGGLLGTAAGTWAGAKIGAIAGSFIPIPFAGTLIGGVAGAALGTLSYSWGKKLARNFTEKKSEPPLTPVSVQQQTFSTQKQTSPVPCISACGPLPVEVKNVPVVSLLEKSSLFQLEQNFSINVSVHSEGNTAEMANEVATKIANEISKVLQNKPVRNYAF